MSILTELPWSEEQVRRLKAQDEFDARAAADGDTGLCYEARRLIRELSVTMWTTPPGDRLRRLSRARMAAYRRYKRRRKKAGLL